MIPLSLFDDNIHIQTFLSADVVFKDDKGTPFYAIRDVSDENRMSVRHSLYIRLQEDEQLMEQYGYKTESRLKSYSIEIGDCRFIVSRKVDHFEKNSIDVSVIYHKTMMFFHTSDEIELFDCALALLFNRDMILFNPFIANESTRASSFMSVDERKSESMLNVPLRTRLNQLRKEGWSRARFSCLSYYPYSECGSEHETSSSSLSHEVIAEVIRKASIFIENRQDRFYQLDVSGDDIQSTIENALSSLHSRWEKEDSVMREIGFECIEKYIHYRIKIGDMYIELKRRLATNTDMSVSNQIRLIATTETSSHQWLYEDDSSSMVETMLSLILGRYIVASNIGEDALDFSEATHVSREEALLSMPNRLHDWMVQHYDWECRNEMFRFWYIGQRT